MICCQGKTYSNGEGSAQFRTQAADVGIELRWCAEAAWFLEVGRVAPKIPSDRSLAWCHKVTPRLQYPVASRF
jgi:hypothetical protein